MPHRDPAAHIIDVVEQWEEEQERPWVTVALHPHERPEATRRDRLLCALLEATNFEPTTTGYAIGGIGDLSSSQALFEEGVRAKHFATISEPLEGRLRFDLDAVFIHYFDLIPDDHGCGWKRADESGRIEAVVEVKTTGRGVEMAVRKDLLRRFLASRQASLLICQSAILLDRPLRWSEDQRIERKDGVAFWRGNGRWTCMESKFVVRPVGWVPLTAHDDGSPREPVRFVLGTHPDGRRRYGEIRSEHDHETLSGELLYFRPQVLDRYRSHGAATVSESEIRVWGGFLLPFDMTEQNLVAVWGQDLGALPSNDLQHWATHSIPPEGDISETQYLRDIMGEWVEDPRPTMAALRDARRALAAAFEDHLGASLFIQQHQNDRERWECLALTPHNDVDRLTADVLTLSKSLVDALNLNGLKSLGANEAGSLNAFADVLAQSGLPAKIEGLRELQSLRSTGMAHARGSKWEAGVKRYGWDLTDPAGLTSDLVGRLTTELNQLACLLQQRGRLAAPFR